MPKSKDNADNKAVVKEETPQQKPVQDVDFNSLAFQQNLDKQVSPAFFDVEEKKEEPVKPEPVLVESQEPVESSDNKDDELSSEELAYIRDKYKLVDGQRYEDSSGEGKRLAAKVKEWEPYAPLLDTIAKDKGLQKQIYSYLESGGEAPKSVKDEFKLPDDYVFDADEAMKNPTSVHRQVLQSMVVKEAEAIVEKKLGKIREEESHKREQDRLAMEARSFKEKNGIDDAEFEKMIEWSKGQPITLQDLHYLYTRKDRDKKIATSAIKDKISQGMKVGAIPRSMGAKGEASIDKSEDDQIFDSLLKTRKGQVIF